MKEEKLIELIHKKSTNELTNEERLLLSTLLENKENQLLADQIESVWEKSLDYGKDFEPNVEQGLSKLKARIRSERVVEPKVVSMQGRRLWLRVAVAAAILIVGGWFAWSTFNNNLDWQEVAVTNASQELNLSDGSQIWVNFKSNFSYPTEFGANQRMVKLTGEAFFDIVKNPEKPFIIESGNLKIKVLGTSFNIRNYENENFAQITVRTGKVEVTYKDSGFSKVLEANDRLIFDKRKRKAAGLSKDENLNDLAWWSGKIQFTNEKVSRMKEVIEHAYQVELEFDNPKVLNCPYTISNDVKEQGIQAFFDALEIGLHFEKIEKISEKKYRLIGGKCSF